MPRSDLKRYIAGLIHQCEEQIKTAKSEYLDLQVKEKRCLLQIERLEDLYIAMSFILAGINKDEKITNLKLYLEIEEKLKNLFNAGSDRYVHIKGMAAEMLLERADQRKH